MRTGWTKAVALAQVYYSQTLLAQVLHTQALSSVLQFLRDGSYHWSLCWLHMATLARQICGKTAERHPCCLTCPGSTLQGSCFPRITMKKKLCANNRSIEPPAPSEGKQTPGSPQIRECFASLHPNRLTIFLGCCHGDRVTQRSACCRTIN